MTGHSTSAGPMQPTSRSTLFWMGVFVTLALSGAILLAPMARESVPRTGVGFQSVPDLVICEGAPDWAKPDALELKRALSFLSDHGMGFGQVYTAACDRRCTGLDPRGSHVEVPCAKNTVVLTRAPRDLRADWGGACFTDDNAPWATVVVDPVPQAKKDLLLAHELAHCRGFLGHARGPSFYGLVLAPRPGHLLHPDLSKAGWKLTALPE